MRRSSAHQSLGYMFTEPFLEQLLIDSEGTSVSILCRRICCSDIDGLIPGLSGLENICSRRCYLNSSVVLKVTVDKVAIVCESVVVNIIHHALFAMPASLSMICIFNCGRNSLICSDVELFVKITRGFTLCSRWRYGRPL